MDTLLLWTGRLAGAVGMVICALAIVLRVKGDYWVGGFQLGTLLQAGIAAMVIGCFLLLVVLTLRSRA